MATTPVPPGRTLRELRSLTPARVGLGRSGAGLPTDALLAFTLDHARARDAVHAAFDVPDLLWGIAGLGIETLEVRSQVGDRTDYLRRPDLGRSLDEASRHLLASRVGDSCQLVVVVGDGLSPMAVNRHAVELIRTVVSQLAWDGTGIDCAFVAAGARVALGDQIGEMLSARMLLMLIGERPGLSAPDSLGAYLTFAPRVGLTGCGAQLRFQHPRRGIGL